MRAIVTGVDDQRTFCEQLRDMLRNLTQIHLELDPPERQIAADEPVWVLRLRKVCFHVLAMSQWEISDDIAHVLAVELRAAYVQMDDIVRSLPGEFGLGEMDAKEARSGLLARYDHPTSMSLASPFEGGFGEIEKQTSYIRLASWMCHIGGGYGLAISRLAEVLGVGGDVHQRVAAVMGTVSVGPP